MLEKPNSGFHSHMKNFQSTISNERELLADRDIVMERQGLRVRGREYGSWLRVEAGHKWEGRIQFLAQSRVDHQKEQHLHN